MFDDVPDEFVKVIILCLKEIDFLLALLLVDFSPVRAASLNGLEFGLELNDIVCLFLLLFLVLGNPLVKYSHAFFSLHLLPHCEGC